MKNKTGEITTTQIVLLIVLIVSFAVILFFIFRLNLGKTTDDQICHNSVITRSTGVFAKETIPLQCKTNYICISKDGTCESMTSPNVEKVTNTEETYRILADEMANCWWMFGEGKLNYVGDTFTSELMCSLCSQIGFDNSLNDIFETGEIDKNNFYSYLSSTNYSDEGISYLDYLVGLKNSQSMKDALSGASISDVIYVQKQFGLVDIYFRYNREFWSWAFLNPGESLDSIGENRWSTTPSLGVSKRTELISSLNGKNLEEGEIILQANGATELERIVSNYETDFGKIFLNKRYFITMGIFSKVDTWQWAIAGAAGAVGGAALAVITGGASIPATVALVIAVTGGGTGGYLIGTAVQGAEGRRFLSPTIIEANSEDFNKLQCGSIRTLA